MKLNTYKINSNMKRFEGDNVIYPVMIEVQTTSKKIETYCIKNFNALLGFKELGMDEMYMLQKMKTYIKQNLTSSDIKDIVDIFERKGWLNSLDTSSGSKSFKFKMTDWRCKWSSDKFPFLMIDAEISINIKSVVNDFISKNILSVGNAKNNLTKQSAELYFASPLPYILVYERSFDISNKVLQIISELMGKSSTLESKVAKEMGFKKISDLRKEIMWIEDRKIKILINDASAVLMKNAKKNWIPLTFAAVVAYKHKQKKKNLQMLKQQANVFQKMMDVVQAAKDEDII